MNGAMVLVPVTLNRTVQTYMVLDTGASYTVVSRQIASNLGLRVVSQGSFMTGNGVISMPLAKLKVQIVLEFFGQEAVAKVVKESPKLVEPE